MLVSGVTMTNQVEDILEALRMLDDDVVLVLGTMEHIHDNGLACLLANACQVVAPAEVDWCYVPAQAEIFFGKANWHKIYESVLPWRVEELEEAFVARLDEATRSDHD